MKVKGKIWKNTARNNSVYSLKYHRGGKHPLHFNVDGMGHDTPSLAKLAAEEFARDHNMTIVWEE